MSTYIFNSIIGLGWGFYVGQFLMLGRALQNVRSGTELGMNNIGQVFLYASLAAVIILVLACLMYRTKTGPILWMLAVFGLGVVGGGALYTSGLQAVA